MRIQHNIAALNSYRNLGGNNNAVSKNLEKLSSGYRINRAGDDAAGLAISEKMRSQITGLETAKTNAEDGISLIQTAEGALQETHSMLNRMVELATQSANGTYTDTERGKLQSEIESLTTEMDRIATSTNFNGINLLDGSMKTPESEATVGALSGTAFTNTSKPTATNNKGEDLTFTFGTAAADSGEIEVAFDANDPEANIRNLNAALKENGVFAQVVLDENGDLASEGTAKDLELQVGDTSASFQKISVSVDDMSAKGLGLEGLDISDAEGADAAIAKINAAIEKVSANRSNLGAVQNRLNHTINNLGTTTENLVAAESRVRDVDMAEEMMNYTKNNILVQASQAMLAQANQVPQGVLQLLQ